MMYRAFEGARAGLLATLPMTGFMRSVFRLLPASAQHPLPPEQITAKAARKVGVETQPHAPGWEWKTYIGHFLFGAAAGALYSLIAKRPAASREAAVARGCAYGLAVWTISYLGWLPALGILPSAARQQKSRNVLMIAVHLVWGSSLALTLEDPPNSDGLTGCRNLINLPIALFAGNSARDC